MARRKVREPKNDTALRRARRLVRLAAQEFGPPSPRGATLPGTPPRGAVALSSERRRRIIGLIAELGLVIKAMRQHRDELGQKISLVFRNRRVVSAYHRTSLLLNSDRRGRH